MTKQEIIKQLWSEAKSIIAATVIMIILSVLIFGGRILIEINFYTAKQLIETIIKHLK